MLNRLWVRCVIAFVIASALTASASFAFRPGYSMPVVWDDPVNSDLLQRAVRVDPPTTTVPPSTKLVNYDCDSWRSTFEKYGLPWWQMRPIAYRETRCAHLLNDNPRTGDYSIGVLQVNFIGSLNAAWNRAGWTREMVLADPEAGVAIAGAFYRYCGGLGPWDKRGGYWCRYIGTIPTPAEMGYAA